MNGGALWIYAIKRIIPFGIILLFWNDLSEFFNKQINISINDVWAVCGY